MKEQVVRRCVENGCLEAREETGGGGEVQEERKASGLVG
jgi:hypothetical protein